MQPLATAASSFGRSCRSSKEEYIKSHKPAVQEERPKQQPKTNKKPVGGVIVDGMEGCLIKFSRCCNPLPGDEIIGFITRGFGVSIHKRSCSNVPKVIQDAPEPERWIQAHWEAWSKKCSNPHWKSWQQTAPVCWRMSPNSFSICICLSIPSIHARQRTAAPSSR